MDEQRKRVLRRWLWALGVLVVALAIVFALFVGPWLLTRFPHQDVTAEQELKAKNDVRTTLVQALAGLAVAGGLIVTYRTFRQTRIDQDRTYERELYANAIEQLGHDHAPVRLGALYSLVSLAQDRPHRRPMVVDVLCAYLRMPYAPPESAAVNSKHDPAQELQVRLTAERLLHYHLRCPDGVSGEDAQHLPRSPDEYFWPSMSLDLTGAYLIDFSLRRASVVNASFTGATFSGDAWFVEATFSGAAIFQDATFTGHAWFDRAAFTHTAWLDRAIFTGVASFRGVTFSGDAQFARATFTGNADLSAVTFRSRALFGEATFSDDAYFAGATFNGDALFEEATFSGVASFGRATFSDLAQFALAIFSGDALFGEATFNGLALFGPATFSGDARFARATFTGDAWFGRATFRSDAVFEGATFTGDGLFDRATFGQASFRGADVLNLDDPDASRVWPNGWTVRTSADDPTRGTLIQEPPGSS